MDKRVTCQECETLQRELTEVYHEAWASLDQPTRDYSTALYHLIGGTKDDAEQAEGLLPKARFQEHLKVVWAMGS